MEKENKVLLELTREELPLVGIACELVKGVIDGSYDQEKFDTIISMLSFTKSIEKVTLNDYQEISDKITEKIKNK